MSEHTISDRDRHCIADCIRRFWGPGDRPVDETPESRDRAYTDCLDDCRVCA